jgi:hypothetical protein
MYLKIAEDRFLGVLITKVYGAMHMLITHSSMYTYVKTGYTLQIYTIFTCQLQKDGFQKERMMLVVLKFYMHLHLL